MPLYVWVILGIVAFMVSTGVKMYEKNKDRDALAKRKASLAAQKHQNRGL